MRTELFFDDVDATTEQSSSNISFEKRAGYLVDFRSTGTNGEVRIVIEYSIDNTGVRFNAVQDPETRLPYFTMDSEGKLSIMDDRIPSKFIRFRLDPNDNTTGTVSGDLGYKTYP